MSDHSASLDLAAPLLNVLQRDPSAHVCYDLFAGGLSWSDESPTHSLENVGKSVKVLRPLIRFRASLIEGNPDERFRPLWDEAIRKMPNWPGFAPERRESTLLPLLKEMEEQAQAEIDELESKLTGSTQVASNA